MSARNQYIAVEDLYRLHIETHYLYMIEYDIEIWSLLCDYMLQIAFNFLRL